MGKSDEVVALERDEACWGEFLAGVLASNVLATEQFEDGLEPRPFCRTSGPQQSTGRRSD